MRGTPKGRQVDPQAREEVQALLKDDPRRRDLLIEYLHRLQDRYGHLSAAHLVALAAEMKLAMTEVYEVATFYHHFDVVKDGEAAPPAITVRVCDSISCEMAGANELLAKLPGILGKDVRVLHAPCIGRCETAPAAVVGQNPVPHASAEKIASLVKSKALKHPGRASDASAPRHREPRLPRLRGLPRERRLRARQVVHRGREEARGRDRGRWTARACAGSGGAGFPTGRKWKSVAAEPAPRLCAINIDEGEPGTFKDRWYLERDPHRFVEGALIAAWAVGIDEIYIYLRDEYHGCRAILEKELAALQAESAVQAAADPPAPRRRRLHLRRGIGDDRIDRRQARHAAAAPAVRRAGGPVRPAHARAQHGDAALGARDPREAARTGSPRTAATAARACARSR